MKTFQPQDYENGPDFRRAQNQIATPFEYLDVDLTLAGSNVIFQVAGDFLYVDPDPGGSQVAGGSSKAGFAALELNNQQNAPVAPFFIQAGFGLEALFKQIKLSWPAQPGKLLRIMYSTGARVVPTNSSTIAGAINVVGGSNTAPAVYTRESPYQYGASYKSNGLLAANSSHAVFAAGANVNGAILWRASMVSGNATALPSISLAAETFVPNSTVVGDVIATANFSNAVGGAPMASLTVESPIYIAAGKGLFFTTSVAETLAHRAALYTLL